MRLEPRPLTTVEPASTRSLGQLEEIAPRKEGRDFRAEGRARSRFGDRSGMTMYSVPNILSS